MGTHQSTTHHHREKWAVSKARAQSYTANTQNQESRVAIMHILILSCLQYNVTLVTTDCGWWWCMEAVKWRWLAALLHWCQVSSSAGCLLWLKESLVIPSQAGARCWRCCPGAVTMQIAGRVSSLLHPRLCHETMLECPNCDIGVHCIDICRLQRMHPL